MLLGLFGKAGMAETAAKPMRGRLKAGWDGRFPLNLVRAASSLANDAEPGKFKRDSLGNALGRSSALSFVNI